MIKFEDAIRKTSCLRQISAVMSSENRHLQYNRLYLQPNMREIHHILTHNLTNPDAKCSYVTLCVPHIARSVRLNLTISLYGNTTPLYQHRRYNSNIVKLYATPHHALNSK